MVIGYQENVFKVCSTGERKMKKIKKEREEIRYIAWKCGYADASYFSNCFRYPGVRYGGVISAVRNYFSGFWQICRKRRREFFESDGIELQTAGFKMYKK